MFRKSLTLLFLPLLALMLSGCGGGVDCQTTAWGAGATTCGSSGGDGGNDGGTNPPVQIIYTISGSTNTANQLQSYSMDSNTNFTLLNSAASPVASDAGPAGLVLINKKFLFASYSAATGDSVQTFPYTVGANYTLTSAGSPLSLPGPAFTDPQHRFLFSAGTVSNVGYILVYTIDSNTGALSPAAGSPYMYQGPYRYWAFDRTGKFLYLYDLQFDNTVHVLQIMDNGALSELQPMQLPGTLSLRPSPTSDTMYSTFATYDSSSQQYVASSFIRAYSISPYTGSLSALGTYATTSPVWDMAIHPNGKFLYTDDYPGNMEGFSIDDTGALSPLPGSPFSAITYTFFVDPKFSADGTYLFESNANPISVDPSTGAVSEKRAFSASEGMTYTQIAEP